MANPSDRPPHTTDGNEKAPTEDRTPAGDAPTGQQDFMSNEERAKEEVQEGEAEQLPSGTENSSETQGGSGKVYFTYRHYLRSLMIIHVTDV